MHTEHTQTSMPKWDSNPWSECYDFWRRTQWWGETNSGMGNSAGRHTTNYFLYIILATKAKVKGHPLWTCSKTCVGFGRYWTERSCKEAYDRWLLNVWYGAVWGFLWKLWPENKLLVVILSRECSSSDEKWHCLWCGQLFSCTSRRFTAMTSLNKWLSCCSVHEACFCYGCKLLSDHVIRIQKVFWNKAYCIQ
jgi:hypothetical protein